MSGLNLQPIKPRKSSIDRIFLYNVCWRRSLELGHLHCRHHISLRFLSQSNVEGACELWGGNTFELYTVTFSNVDLPITFWSSKVFKRIICVRVCTFSNADLQTTFWSQSLQENCMCVSDRILLLCCWSIHVKVGPSGNFLHNSYSSQYLHVHRSLQVIL